MWKRKDLKSKAKLGVKRNYWKSVLAALLFSMAVGGVGVASGIGGSFGSFASNSASSEFDSLFAMIPPSVIIALVVIAVAAIALAVFVSIALINPFAVGVYKYALNAVRETGNISDLGGGFDVGYKRNVKVMFLTDLYIILWSLLFIIPGIIKSYEYKMIPYLLAENPEMGKEEAFAASKSMMKGNKWRAFVLDLSFILWDILSGLTLGIVELFWVAPYKLLTNAALYDALRHKEVE